MKKKLMVLSGLVLGLSPVIALAANTGGTVCGASSGAGASAQITNLGDLMCKIQGLLNMVVPVLIALGVVFFVWGVIVYVVSSDEEAKKKGRDRMIWGIIGLAVIIAMWGLVNILTSTFGLQNSNTGNINLPTVQ